jgi:predicted DNA-binding transcriptional regulator AlpA
MTAKLISAKDVAQRYSIHVKTVYKWTYRKVLPVVKISRNCVRYDVEKCDAALERRTRKICLTITLLFGVLLQSVLANSATSVQQEVRTIEGQPFAMRRSGVRIPYSPRFFFERLIARISEFIFVGDRAAFQNHGYQKSMHF